MSGPQIVLVGKSKQDHPEMSDILKNIKASQVPHEILDSVYVTVCKDDETNRYEIDKKTFAKNKVSYKNIGEHVSSLGIREEILGIEIVVDLDRVHEYVRSESSRFFDAVCF